MDIYVYTYIEMNKKHYFFYPHPKCVNKKSIIYLIFNHIVIH